MEEKSSSSIEKPITGEIASKEVAAPLPAKLKPWDTILNQQDDFLAELDCIGEMVSLILPDLQSRDEERSTEILNLLKSIGGLTKNPPRILQTLKTLLVHFRRINKAQCIFRENMIVSMVARFDVFLADLLRAAYRENINWLQASDRKLSYKEIFELESIDTLKAELIDREVDQLMRDSHSSQLAFLDERLKLGIRSEFPHYAEFLEITERRNLYVHANGIVSDIYLDNSRRWGFTCPQGAEAGKYLTADDAYLRASIECFYELSIRISQAAIRRLYKDSLPSADSRLQLAGFGLLQEQKWSLAENLTTFALSIPLPMVSLGEWRYLNTINLCISRKACGKSIEESLRSVDWSGLHPRYQLAVAVLEDRFSDAAAMMRRGSLKGEISLEDYRDWPLFRAFRETTEFEVAFAEVFGTSLSAAIAAETAQLLDDSAKALPDAVQAAVEAAASSTEAPRATQNAAPDKSDISAPSL